MKHNLSVRERCRGQSYFTKKNKVFILSVYFKKWYYNLKMWRCIIKYPIRKICSRYLLAFPNFLLIRFLSTRTFGIKYQSSGSVFISYIFYKHVTPILITQRVWWYSNMYRYTRFINQQEHKARRFLLYNKTSSNRKWIHKLKKLSLVY